MSIDAQDHEGPWKKRVGELEVSDIGALASCHPARCPAGRESKTTRRTHSATHMDEPRRRPADCTLGRLEDDLTVLINAW